MIITLHRTGGFAAVPGLSRKLSVDTATLSKGQADELESAVRAARIDQRAGQSSSPSGSRSSQSGDRYTYHLTVHDGTTRHAVAVTEPFTDPAMDTLIDLLSSYS